MNHIEKFWISPFALCTGRYVMLLCMCWFKHIIEFYGGDTLANLREEIICFVMSDRLSACYKSAATWSIFMASNTWTSFENLSKKFKFFTIWQEDELLYISTYVHYVNISVNILRMGNITKLYRKSEQTCFVQWFFPKFCPLWNMWKI